MRHYLASSFHEMGLYDLPAELQYIAELKKSKIIYIGHSMGTTNFYVMASQRPNTASMVEIMFSLAPIAFMAHTTSPFKMLAPVSNEMMVTINAWEKTHYTKLNQSFH